MQEDKLRSAINALRICEQNLEEAHTQLEVYEQHAIAILKHCMPRGSIYIENLSIQKEEIVIKYEWIIMGSGDPGEEIIPLRVFCQPLEDSVRWYKYRIEERIKDRDKKYKAEQKEKDLKILKELKDKYENN